MKANIIILSALFSFLIADIKPLNSNYIKIERIALITNGISQQIIVSTKPLKIELSDYEKNDFKTSLLKDTDDYIKFRYTLLTTNQRTYKILERFIKANKNLYTKESLQYGYLITERKNSIEKYFAMNNQNASIFFY